MIIVMRLEVLEPFWCVYGILLILTV